MTETILHNTDLQRYELRVDEWTCYLTYSRRGSVVTVLQTIVPPALGGRGLASALTRRALDDARANGDKIIAQCPFTAQYIGKHAEYRDLLAA